MRNPDIASLPEWRPSTAVGRWSTLGPYYAMFPVGFVRRTVETFCPVGGSILDPFCGRGTVPYVAKVTGRFALGTDLNPVAFVFSAVKTDPEPCVDTLLRRIVDVRESVTGQDLLPENDFQAAAWCPDVLAFLHAARRILDWQQCRRDRTLMAIILVHLHGKIGNAVSNQMHQAKAMAPDYALRWWRDRGMSPPEIDPVSYFSSKVRWRYRHGIPQGKEVVIKLADARSSMDDQYGKFAMLLTSPPYYNVTNYRVDNWIRLWMLGEGSLPAWEVSQRYGNQVRYAELLHDVFSNAAEVLAPNAPAYVRTDARQFTLQTTARVMRKIWPHRLLYAHHGRAEKSQTSLYGDDSVKPGEVDLLIVPKTFPVPKEFQLIERGNIVVPDMAENQGIEVDCCSAVA